MKEAMLPDKKQDIMSAKGSAKNAASAPKSRGRKMVSGVMSNNFLLIESDTAGRALPRATRESTQAYCTARKINPTE